MSVYSNPEAFGLTIIGEVDFSDRCYQFDTLVLFRDSCGAFYYAEDSGCSCPIPFDYYTMSSLRRIESLGEFMVHLAMRVHNAYDETQSRIAAAALIDKYMEARGVRYGSIGDGEGK